MYLVIEEASDAIEEHVDNLEEAIEDAKTFAGRYGKYLVVEDTEERKVVFDTMPGVTFKI